MTDELVDGLRLRGGFVLPDAPPRPRSCNLHDNCDAADQRQRIKAVAATRSWPIELLPWEAEHCRVENCEDCYGQ